MLYYVHGFNSSPQSWKARLIAEYIRQQGLPVDYRVPALPWQPAAAADFLREAVAGDAGPCALIGSSLGGYYACWLQAQFGMPVVLLNPAIRPYELLQGYLGENRNLYTDQHYELRAEHVDQLRALETMPEAGARLMYLVQTADETLDYRQAVERFRGFPGVIEYGGSHGFDDFGRWIPAIFAFLGLAAVGRG